MVKAVSLLEIAKTSCEPIKTSITKTLWTLKDKVQELTPAKSADSATKAFYSSHQRLNTSQEPIESCTEIDKTNLLWTTKPPIRIELIWETIHPLNTDHRSLEPPISWLRRDNKKSWMAATLNPSKRDFSSQRTQGNRKKKTLRLDTTWNRGKMRLSSPKSPQKRTD